MRECRRVNTQHLEKVMQLTNNCPYYSLLGLKICELGNGYSRVEMEVQEKLMNPFGSVHGGAYASLIDAAAYWAAYCDQDADAGYTSLDLSVTNLSMTRSGKLIAEGKAIKEGRSMCLCEVTVRDDAGKLVAHGTSKLLILKGRQSISDAMRAAHCPELPDKFED